MKKQLAHTIQCKKCPWKKNTDPNQIPNGYDVEKHKGLRCTIAEPGFAGLGRPLRAMSCHESKTGEESHCIGWLMQQLGPGNNIGLRIQMMGYDLSNVELDGPQHDRFEDTLPKRKRRR